MHHAEARRFGFSEVCKVVGYASGVRLLPATLDPSFLDKGVGTGPVAT